MFDFLLDHISKEWNVIFQAPIAFSICLLFGWLIIFYILEWFHKEKTQAQSETIKLLESRLDEARIALKTTAEATCKPLADNAELHIHCYGDERVPKRLLAQNIWRWYHLRNIFKQININTNETEATTVINLYISFDQPVVVGTLEVNSPDAILPTYEVKEFNNRFAIITFYDELPTCTLIIKAYK